MVNSLYLSHHGVKGQKWGIRRFQYKDGSLTPAGQRRAAKMRTAYTELTGKKLRSHPESLKKSSDKSKSGGKTSDADDQITELKKQKELLTAKKDVLELQNKISELTPKKVSAGKKFIEKFGPTIAKNVWEGVLKNNINKWIENKLGLKVPETESARLKRLATDAQNRYNIEKNKNLFNAERDKAEKRASEKEAQKRASEKETQKRASEKESQKRASEKEAQKRASEKESQKRASEKEAQKRASENLKKAQKQVDDYINSGRKDDRVRSDGPFNNNTQYSRTYSKDPGIGGPTTKSRTEIERYTGTVEGKGTSRVDPRKYYTVDADYRDVKSSNTSSGERFISGLLESGAGILRLEDKRMG